MRKIMALHWLEIETKVRRELFLNGDIKLSEVSHNPVVKIYIAVTLSEVELLSRLGFKDIGDCPEHMAEDDAWETYVQLDLTE